MNESLKKKISIGLVIFFSVLFFFTAFGTFLMTNRYAEVRELLNQRSEELVVLQAEYDQKVTEIEELKKVREELIQTKNQLDDANASLKKVTADLATKQGEYDDLLAKYNTKVSEYDTLSAKVAGLEAQILALNGQNAQLTQDYNQLLSSFETLSKYVNIDTIGKELIPGIVCWGDSLTAGNAGGSEEGNRWSFPYQLRDNVHNDYTRSIDVTSYGWGGKSSGEIVNNVNITLRTRANLQNYIYVVWIGTNGGWSKAAMDENGDPVLDEDGNVTYEEDPATLISHIDLILSTQRESQRRFLVVGLCEGDNESRRELDSALKTAYGNRFINMRQYLATDGMRDAGLTPDADDLARMQIGKVPYAFKKYEYGWISVHFNDIGYTLIGNYLYKKMDELGFFNELKVIKNVTK